MTINPTLSKRVIESLTARSETKQWEELIGNSRFQFRYEPGAV